MSKIKDKLYNEIKDQDRNTMIILDIDREEKIKEIARIKKKEFEMLEHNNNPFNR